MRCTLPVLFLLLGGCASTDLAPDPREALLDGMMGTWDNRAQFAAAPGTLKVPPSVDGEPCVGKGGEPGAFENLGREALRIYGPDCALRFVLTPRGFVGTISAQECTISAASGRRMGINARVALTPDGTLECQESGVLEDGRLAFRVPPTEPYRFRPLR